MAAVETEVYLTIQAANEAHANNVTGIATNSEGIQSLWEQMDYPQPDALILRAGGRADSHNNPYIAHPGVASRYIPAAGLGSTPADIVPGELQRRVTYELAIPRWNLTEEELTGLAIRSLQQNSRSQYRTLGWVGSITGGGVAGLTALGDTAGIIPDGLLADRATWVSMAGGAALGVICLLSAWRGSRELKEQAASLAHIPILKIERDEPQQPRGKHAAPN